MEYIIKGIESQKTGDKHRDFVLNDAVYYIKKAQEALDEGLSNPEQWYRNEQINSSTFFSLFPQIYFTQQRLASDSCFSQSPSCPKSSQ
jgi:hypothetical protein